MDRWDRKTDFGYSSCMFYVPKKEHSSVGSPAEEGRCRRSAPTMKGYPVVFADDWCGEHKRGSNPVRDSAKVTKEDVRKVLDEPLDSPAFDQPLTIEVKEEIHRLVNTICLEDINNNADTPKMNTCRSKILKLLEKL